MIQITSNMIYNNINNQLDNESVSIYNLEDQISTGLQINQPQDNPAGQVNVLSYQNSLSNLTQYTSNVNQASEISALASSTASNAISVVNTAKTLALQMANGTNSTANNQAAANQVGQLINEIQQIAGTNYNGENIFTGEDTSIPSAYTSSTAYYTPPSSTSGAPVHIPYSVYTYAGNNVQQKYQITQDETLAPSVTADEMFGSDNPPVSTSSSTSTTPTALLSVLSLFQSELKSNNYAKNSSLIINGLSNGLSRLTAAQATIGTKQERLTEQTTSYQTVNANIQQLLGDTQDVNIAQATTNLTQAQTTYQATLAMSSEITQLTPMLLKYLG
jgi:flagellar hook-associated protein 3 FlgL